MDNLGLPGRYAVVGLNPSPHRGRVRYPSIEAPRRLLVFVAKASEKIADERHQGCGDLLLQVPVAPVIEVSRRRVAVRDRHGPIREPDPLDERTGRHQCDVRFRRHMQRPRRVRIERQEQAVTLAQEQPLEIARAKGPSRQFAVSAAIVEEGVHGRIGPHCMKRLDNAFGAAALAEVLMGQCQLHRPRMRCRATRAAKTGRTRCRRQRRGSNARRQSHSSPTAWTNRGGNRTRPASWSKTPPTPIAVRTDARSGRFREIHRSCAGMP